MLWRHLERSYQPREFVLLVREMAKILTTKKHDYDAIAFCGLSGAPLAGALSYRLHKPLIVVRKGDDRHYNRNAVFSAADDVRRYIIVDDLIETGTTVNHIKDRIKEIYFDAKCVGIYLYAQQLMMNSCDNYDSYQELVDVPCHLV